jgi:hypothetical protein
VGILLVVVLLLIIGVGVAVGLSKRNKLRARGSVVRQVAVQHGWRYANDDVSLVPLVRQLPFNDGAALRGQARNVAYGHLDGWQTVLFELLRWEQTTIGGGMITGPGTVHSHQIWVVRLPRPMPYLRVVPELSAFASIGWAGKVTFNDPAFDRAMTVHAGDQGFAHTVLHPGMRQWLLSQPIGWAIDEGNLVAWVDRKVLDPNELIGRLRFVTQIARAVSP